MSLSCYLAVLFSLMNVLSMTKCYDLQRLSERIDKMEMKILTEGMFTREDVHEIQVAMERLETRLNLTFLDAENLLKKTNILEGLKTSVEELTIFEISTEAKLANISDTLQNLKADLEKEKYENGKTRRHVINLDNTIASLTNHSKTISDNVYSIVTGLKHLSNSVSKLPLNQTIQYETYTDKDQPKGLRSCLDALHKGIKSSGIITIRSNSSKRPVKVSCDQETDGGGWIVFQRRQDGSVDFYRNWQDYKDGFGSLNGEFWLGNDIIHQLLAGHSNNELRIDLQDFDDNKRYAKYNTFYVSSESENYTLTVDGYSGNAGDSLTYHNRQMFSTKDRDNDIYSDTCSVTHKAGWWFRSCSYASLNGVYTTDPTKVDLSNIVWFHWMRNRRPLKFTEMKFRETG